MNSFETVYRDKTVLITDLYIKIYKYYLPLATSKTIFFKQISHIIYYKDRAIDVIWGASSDKLKDWFPFDDLRKCKKGYFQIVLKQKNIRPCFSPVDPQRAFNVIWVNHSQEGKKWKNNEEKSIYQQIMLSSKQEALQTSFRSDLIQVLSKGGSSQLINQNGNITQIQQKQKEKNLLFADLTNLLEPKNKTDCLTDSKIQTQIKYVTFEESSFQGSSQRQNDQLIDEPEFYDLS